MNKSVVYKSFYLSIMASTWTIATEQFETPTKTVEKHIQVLIHAGTYDGLTPTSQKDMEDIDRRNYTQEFKKKQLLERQKALDEDLNQAHQKKMDEIKTEGGQKTQELQKTIENFTQIREQDSNQIKRLNTEIENLNTSYNKVKTQFEKEQESVRNTEKELQESKNLSQQEIINLTKTLESKKKFVSLLKKTLEETIKERNEMQENLSATQRNLKNTQMNLETTEEQLSQTNKHLSILETAFNGLTLSSSTPSLPQDNLTNVKETLPQVHDSSSIPEVTVETTVDPSLALGSQLKTSKRRGIVPEANKK